MRIILGKFIFHLLHHFYEIVETDALIIGDLAARVVWFLVTLLILLGVSNAILSNLLKQHLGFDRASVERLHDGLEVGDANGTVLLAIKQLEDLAQVLHLFLAELHVVATVLLLLINLCRVHG